MKKSDIVFIVMFTLLAGFISGIHFSQQQKTELRFLNLPAERQVVTYLPAVDTAGNGVVGVLRTSIKPGSGGVALDVANVLSFLDTQQSAKTAADVAKKYAGITGEFDINYVMDVNASAVEGGSAGAAMAVSVVAALQNRSINSSVMITGTIEPDGSIGMVGSISEKAAAAKAAGATLLLVPEGQSYASELRRMRDCQKFGSYRYCEVNYAQEKKPLNISGIDVIEVGTLGEAAAHMVI